MTLPTKTEHRAIVDTHRHVDRESPIFPIVRLNLLFLQIEVNPAVLFRELRSLLRFNLVFVPVLIVGLGLTFWIVRDQLRRDADELVLVNVHLMLETARAFRVYTSDQVAPILNRQDQELASVRDALELLRSQPAPLATPRSADHEARPKGFFSSPSVVQLARGAVVAQLPRIPPPQFHPQTIPFYAATEAFNYFRQRYPAYNYKEAALNPTNPRDRTTDWEADIVNVFRADPLRTEVAGNRDTPLGPVFYVSAPIRAEASCLECHGDPAQAPAAILKAYGNANGFGWKADEIIGAQVVTVARDVATRLVDRALNSIVNWLCWSLGGIFVVVNLYLFFFLSGSAIVPSVKSKSRGSTEADRPEKQEPS